MLTFKTLLARHALRVPIALLAALTWLAVSKHCTLAALEGPAQMTSMSSCHGMHAGQTPAKQKNDKGVECCKVLRATVPSLAKNLVPHSASGFALQSFPLAPQF